MTEFMTLRRGALPYRYRENGETKTLVIGDVIPADHPIVEKLGGQLIPYIGHPASADVPQHEAPKAAPILPTPPIEQVGVRPVIGPADSEIETIEERTTDGRTVIRRINPQPAGDPPSEDPPAEADE